MFREEPVAFGSVAFLNPDGSVVSGVIIKGTYRLIKVPLGTAKIIVTANPEPPPFINPTDLQATAAVSPKKPFVPIPQRYQDLDKSELTCTVVSGKQTHDIAMKP